MGLIVDDVIISKKLFLNFMRPIKVLNDQNVTIKNNNFAKG